MKNHDHVMIGVTIFTIFRGETMKAILIGILAALFFSVTFILNRSMELEGGSWVWSASFRFMFMLPILFIIVGFKRNVKPVLCAAYICYNLRTRLACSCNISTDYHCRIAARSLFK